MDWARLHALILFVPVPVDCPCPAPSPDCWVWRATVAPASRHSRAAHVVEEEEEGMMLQGSSQLVIPLKVKVTVKLTIKNTT